MLVKRLDELLLSVPVDNDDTDGCCRTLFAISTAAVNACAVVVATAAAAAVVDDDATGRPPDIKYFT